MKMIPMIMLTLSVLFMSSSHPIILMTIILIQALVICCVSWVYFKMSWFSYILFLIFLGGLMVLFIYIASLASNEKFYLKFNSMLTTSNLLFYAMASYLVYLYNKLSMHTEWVSMNFMFNEIYSKTMMTPTAITMIFLLLTLIVVVKVSSKYEGPMRNMIFK